MKYTKKSDKRNKKLLKINKQQTKLLQKMLKNIKKGTMKSKTKITKMFMAAILRLKKEQTKFKDGMGPMSVNQVQFIGAS